MPRSWTSASIAVTDGENGVILPPILRRPKIPAFRRGQVRHDRHVREKSRVFANLPKFPGWQVRHVRHLREKSRVFANLPNLPKFPGGQNGHLRRTATPRTSHP